MPNRLPQSIVAIHRGKLGALSITSAHLFLGPKAAGRGKVAVRQSSETQQQNGIAL